MAKTILKVGTYLVNLEHVTHFNLVNEVYDLYIGSQHVARIIKSSGPDTYAAIEEWLKLRTIKIRSAAQLSTAENFEGFGLEDLDILDISDED